MFDRYRVSYRATARGRLVFAVAATVFLIVFIWAENHLSQNFQTCERQARSYQSTNNPDKSRFIVGRALGRQFVCSVDFLDLHAGFVAAIAGLIVAYFTYTLQASTRKLWDAGERQLKHLEKTSQTELRAYISVQKFVADALVENGVLKGWQFSFIWQNTGSTPTRDLLTHASIYFSSSDLPDDFRFPDTWASDTRPVYIPQCIGPNSISVEGLHRFAVEQLEEVRRGKKFLYFYGWADYNDVFPDTRRHRTEFCVRVEFPGDVNVFGDSRSRNISFGMYRKHNGIDDECMRQPKSKVTRETIPDLPPKTV